MDTVTGFTAARMLAMENATVVDGDIVGDNLVLKTRNNTEIIAGNVRGPQGPIGPDGNPTGTFLMGGWSTAPSGYLLLNGATVIGGVAAYPALASMFPSWVSGGNLILPDTTGVVPLGGATAGVVSGSMTHTLTAANIPEHIHNIASHTHPIPSHTHGIAPHYHAISDHNHYVNINSGGMGYELVTRSSVANTGFATGRDSENDGILDGSTGTVGGMYVSYIGDHGHNVQGWSNLNNGATGTGYGTPDEHKTTNANTAALVSSSNTSALTTSTGPNTGATHTAVNHTPRNLTVRYAVKT